MYNFFFKTGKDLTDQSPYLGGILLVASKRKITQTGWNTKRNVSAHIN